MKVTLDFESTTLHEALRSIENMTKGAMGLTSELLAREFDATGGMYFPIRDKDQKRIGWAIFGAAEKKPAPFFVPVKPLADGSLPDCDEQNDDRAEWAEQAIERFRNVTGTDAGDAVSDLLCDLMHLCDRDGETYGPFMANLDRAVQHYNEETMEG